MNVDKLFDFHISRGTLREGALLVASPAMTGSDYFSHSVITLVNYSLAEGAMGLVMNLPIEGATLHDALPAKVSTEHDAPLFAGGPVHNNRLFYLHTLPEIFSGSEQVLPGLYLGGDLDEVCQYVNSGYPTEGYLRFFVGYSGWTPGQLEHECDEDTWAITHAVMPATRMLTGANDAYWHATVRLMGEPFRHWLHHPKNPSLN